MKRIATVLVLRTATDIVLTPTTTGKFTAICDHFCGAGHGNMRMTYFVED